MARGRRLQAALLVFLTVAKNFFLLPFSLLFFVLSSFICLGLLSVLGFGFLLSGLFLFSPLSCVISLLSLSSGLSFFSARLPLRSSLFIENKTEQVCLLLVHLQSRNGWSAIGAFGGGGGEERERRDGF